MRGASIGFELPDVGARLLERLDVLLGQGSAQLLDQSQQRPQMLRLGIAAPGFLECERESGPNAAPYLGAPPIRQHRLIAHATQLSAVVLGRRQPPPALV